MIDIWKIAVIGKADKIIDLYITKTKETLGEFNEKENHYSPGGAFDAPVYQVVRKDNDDEFYQIVSKLYKNWDNLSKDAKVNLNPYINKGRDKHPEFFV